MNPASQPSDSAVQGTVERERELRALVAPIANELEASSVEMQRELDCNSSAVREVSSYARQYRGKRLRAAVVLLTARSFGTVASSHMKIAAIVEMIHMATLVHDDVLDRADVRRRVPTVNALFGNNVAVLLGDWIYARAFAMSTKLENQSCSRILSEITATLCRGEIEQSRAKYDFNLSIDRYMEMIEAKTAVLYAASCELGALYSGAKDNIVDRAREFGRSLGLAFQIVDDCLDLDGSEEIVGKSLGTDLAEGKITLPILYMMRDLKEAERARVREVFLNLREMDGAAQAIHSPEWTARTARAAQLLMAPELKLRESLEASYALANHHIQTAVSSLQFLPESPARDCLQSMAEYVVRRRW